jgi:hypothetical protein
VVLVQYLHFASGIEEKISNKETNHACLRHRYSPDIYRRARGRWEMQGIMNLEYASAAFDLPRFFI